MGCLIQLLDSCFEVWYHWEVKIISKKPDESLVQISSSDFVKTYNKTVPEGFQRASEALLRKFKEGHPSFFKHGDLWSLDEHRKKLMDWFQLKGENL